MIVAVTTMCLYHSIWSPCVTTMRLRWIRSSFVQVMACRLLGANPYMDQCWLISQQTLKCKLQWNLNRTTNILFEVNAFENTIFGISDILSWPPWLWQAELRAISPRSSHQLPTSLPPHRARQPSSWSSALFVRKPAGRPKHGVNPTIFHT